MRALRLLRVRKLQQVQPKAKVALRDKWQHGTMRRRAKQGSDPGAHKRLGIQHKT